MKLKVLAIALMIALLAACTWVKPTPEGKEVGVATAEEVGDCQSLGKVSVSLKHEVARVERSAKKVAAELETLARNEGAVMGGNTVVPIGRPVEGRQQFNVYTCS